MEERELWIEYKKTGNLEIREKIILQYIPLVKYVVGKMIGNLPNNIEYEDLVEYGIIGLLDAIDKYDVTKNTTFKTYAVTRIRGSIYDELRGQDWVPRSVRKIGKDIEAAYIELEKRYNRAATEEEVAEYLEITVADLSKSIGKISMGNIASLDDIIYQGDDSKATLVETVEDKKQTNPQNKIERDELKAAMVERLKELKEKEKLVMTLYYYEDLTLKEIGKILEVSESRVSQIHSKAILKLRAKLAVKFNAYKNVIE